MTNSPYQPPSSPSPWGSPNSRPPSGGQKQYGQFSPAPQGPGGPGWRPQPQPSAALAIICFIVAIIAFFLGWVPFVGLGLGFIGLVLSIFAVRKPRLRGLPITGIVLSVLAGLTSLVTSILFVLALVSNPSPPAPVDAKSYSPEDFKQVDERTLGEIVKDPDSHKGEALEVYGYVSQFGSDTGNCRMRVSISNEKKGSWVYYDHNALAYSGDHDDSCPEFDDVLEEDQVKMDVVVNGAESYSTLLGGSTSAPALEVIDLEVE